MRSTKLNGQQVLNQTMFPEGIALIVWNFLKQNLSGLRLKTGGPALVNCIRDPGSAHWALPNIPGYFSVIWHISLTMPRVFIQHPPFQFFGQKWQRKRNGHKDFHPIKEFQRDSLGATNSQLNEFKALAINDKKLSAKCRGEPSKKNQRARHISNGFQSLINWS